MIPFAVFLLSGGFVVGYLVLYCRKRKEKVDFSNALNTERFHMHGHDLSDSSTTLHRRGSHVSMEYDQYQSELSPRHNLPYVQRQHQQQLEQQEGTLPRPYAGTAQGAATNSSTTPPINANKGYRDLTLDYNYQLYQHQQLQYVHQQHHSRYQGDTSRPQNPTVTHASPSATTTTLKHADSLEDKHPPPPPPVTLSPLPSPKHRRGRRRSSSTSSTSTVVNPSPTEENVSAAAAAATAAVVEPLRQETPDLYLHSRTADHSQNPQHSQLHPPRQCRTQEEAAVNAYHSKVHALPLSLDRHPDLPLPPQVQPVSPNPSSPVAQRSFLDSQFNSLDMKDIDLVSIIGGGSFGQVWKGVWQGTPVAVKILSSACQVEVSPGVLQTFRDEVQMLARLRHPNICLFLGACLDPPCRTIVTEIVSRGSLWDALRTPHLFEERGRGDIFHWPWWVIRRVLDGTCRGLVYLHGNQPAIIHRDLKSANLLLDDSFNVKICDFGLARLRDYTSTMTANVGTAQWTAPEVLAGKDYNESADMYSLGIVTWELLTGKCPYEHISNQVEIAITVAHNKTRPILSPLCPKKVRTFIETCWAEEPGSRMSAREALKSLEAAIPVI